LYYGVMNFGQTEYTEHDTGKKIALPFPAALLTKLASEYSMDAGHLTISDISKLFPILVGRWLDGSVQTEELSSIANFFIGVTKYENDELTKVLVAASELSYYIRHTDPNRGEPLHGFVTDLRAYFY
jgi:hypothetical protein